MGGLLKFSDAKVKSESLQVRDDRPWVPSNAAGEIRSLNTATNTLRRGSSKDHLGYWQIKSFMVDEKEGGQVGLINSLLNLDTTTTEERRFQQALDDVSMCLKGILGSIGSGSDARILFRKAKHELSKAVLFFDDESFYSEALVAIQSSFLTTPFDMFNENKLQALLTMIDDIDQKMPDVDAVEVAIADAGLRELPHGIFCNGHP